jgi:hypothetical protein
MALEIHNWRNAALAGLMGMALSLGGCGGVDMDINVPILEAAGINLSSKKKDDEDVPERAALVLPPTTEKLPEPGQRTASAPQNWPKDAEKAKKRKAEEDQAAYEKYCREGDWSSNANSTEFNKNIGVEQRCPSQLGKAISKAVGGGPATTQQ